MIDHEAFKHLIRLQFKNYNFAELDPQKKLCHIEIINLSERGLFHLVQIFQLLHQTVTAQLF